MIAHTHHGASGAFWVSAAMIFVAFVYLCERFRVRKSHQNSVASWRVGSFLFGLLFIWIATASPLAVLDHEMLTAHMVQHLLLMTVAPSLVLLGMPRRLQVHGPLQPISRFGQPLKSATPQQQLVIRWLVAAVTLVMWHIPVVLVHGLRSQTWHGIEQVSFLASGLLFWWPVIEPSTVSSERPEWSIILYLFSATLPCDILSGFLVFCDRVVYPVFLSSHQIFGLSALEDQQCAGALMWTCVTVVYLIAASVYAARLLSPHRSDEQPIPPFEPQRLPMSHSGSQGMEAV